MNEESLRRANAFLAAIARRVEPGGVLEASPAEIGREAGFNEPLAAARAVRALRARKRIETEGGAYRLLDARPLEPGEPEAVPRKPRKRKAAAATPGGKPTYSDLGHAVIERLVELGGEVASLRVTARTAKEEAREHKHVADDAERSARELSARVRDLEAKLEMAEQNLRTLLVAAKGGTGGGKDAGPVGDSEMEAILGVLKGGEEAGAPPLGEGASLS